VVGLTSGSLTYFAQLNMIWFSLSPSVRTWSREHAVLLG
jgi:hypothetical protein